MGKLEDRLSKQLETEFKEEAQECFRIFKKLIDIKGGVYSSDWQILVNVYWCKDQRIYKPSAVGKVFLAGCEREG